MERFLPSLVLTMLFSLSVNAALLGVLIESSLIAVIFGATVGLVCGWLVSSGFEGVTTGGTSLQVVLAFELNVESWGSVAESVTVVVDVFLL